jgi:hypothetical protein
MTSNQVVSTMFEFNTYNHMNRFVLQDDGNEDLGSHHINPSCDGVLISLYLHIDPPCMSCGYFQI